MGVFSQGTRLWRKAQLTAVGCLIVSFSLISFHAEGLADCRGCCSGNGGVTCNGGTPQCGDGSDLSAGCTQKGCNPCLETEPDCNGHLAFGFPGMGDAEQILCREGYVAAYDYDRKTPVWVAYHLTPETVNARFKRSNRFKPDTDVPWQYRSSLDDYRRSGYDRGHMAASATVDSSYRSMEESFLLSNMTPQLPGFNRQGWRILEEHVRDWVNERGELYGVTGALFPPDQGRVIGNGVHVPSYFYKVIFDSVSMDAIAFLIPHEPFNGEQLERFIVSVDTIEALTGLDFIHYLDDAEEADIEEDVDSLW